MSCLRRALCLLVTTVAALLLAGCANLDGVREFTASAARMTDYRDATERYFESTDRMLAEIPATADFTAARARLEAQKRDQAGQKAALLKLHATATGYMAALAKLAGDGTFDLSKDVDRVGGALGTIPGVIDQAQLSAYAGIARTVTSWATAAVQARDVTSLAREHGDAMDTLLGALQTASALYETALRNERAAVRSFEDARELSWRSPIGNESSSSNADRDALADRREAIVAWARRSQVAIEQEEDAAVADAHRAALGMAKVREGHAAMLRNLDHLDRQDLEALLKKAAADLKTLRASVQRIR